MRACSEPRSCLSANQKRVCTDRAGCGEVYPLHTRGTLPVELSRTPKPHLIHWSGEVAMPLPPSELIALLVATSFAAGLNVYLTVAVLGILGHTSALPLPGSLQPLMNWYVIAAAGVLFAVEFFGDKIPAFDLIWNALHTFIRVPVAAFIAFRATAALSPGEQLAATLAGGLIALAAHGGKTAARALVTPSPEPLSNISLSLSEDALALFLVWFAAHHPYAAGCIALVLVLIVIVAVRWVARALRALFRGAERAAG